MLPLNVSISDISSNSSFGRHDPNLETYSGNNSTFSHNSTFSTMFSRESPHVFNETHLTTPGKVQTITSNDPDKVGLWLEEVTFKNNF